MEEVELVHSKYCQTISRDGRTVRVEIYGTGKADWILEVVDEDGNSIVWEEPFSTDDDAIHDFQRTLEEEGIEGIIGTP